MEKANVLIVDDEQAILEVIARSLKDTFSITTANNEEQALLELNKINFSVVVTDLKMPGVGGFGILKDVKKIDKDIEVIIISGFATIETVQQGLRDGVFDFISKPFELTNLSSRIKKAIESYHSKKTIALLNEGLKQTYIELEQLKDTLEEKVLERTRELELSEKRNKSIIDSSFDPIITVTNKGIITSWNKGSENLFGFAFSETQGKTICQLAECDKENLRTNIIEKAIADGYSKNYMTQFVSKSGNTVFTNVTASKINDTEIALIIRDITKEKKVEQMKTDFVSNVSHELRTPLTSIKGAIDLILAGTEGPITSSQKEFLNICKNNAVRLIRLISDLLDLSKIEAGKIKMEIKNNEIVKTINETLAEFRALAEKQKITLKYNGPDTYQLPYDEDRTRQVLTNLLGNAFKFTQENGNITIYLKDKENEAEIGVKDSGIGIAKENFDMVFEKFQQVDSSSTRAKGGTGLGLAITKSIVEAHKGKIWLESEVGKGTSFIFTYPKQFTHIFDKNDDKTEIPSWIKEMEKNQQAFSVKKVLVIDDDDDMVRVIQEHLEKNDFEVTILKSGMDALKTAIETKPDLITLDLLMPSIDGFAVAELLKQNPITKNIPIVIISAIFEKEKAYKLGISDYITKPFNTKELFNSIDKIESLITGERAKKKIMIVDDDPDIASVLALSLNDRNYQIINIYDGLQALATAKREIPDIILLDLMLPELDGFEVLKKIKQDPETAKIPIIVMTGRGEKDRDTAMKMGANEYLLKPFSIKSLHEQLDTIIKNTPEVKDAKKNSSS